jgi:predicted permease
VVAASPGMTSPLSGEFALAKIIVPGYQPRPNERGIIAANWIGPAYFKTLGTPLVAGRAFSEKDSDRKVAIVNEKAAGHYWANEDPIGKHAITSDGDCEIVGVVKNVKSESLRGEAEPALYLPYRQNARGHVTLHVRVSGETTPVISAVLREIRALDPNLPAFNVTTMERQLDRSLALDRLMGALTALFAVLAVVLAAIGLYGVMAFTVTARTREIGIRMALGADSARVLRQVIGESAVLTAMGIALGLPAAMWASRSVGSFLYGLKATDPLTYGALSIMLAAVALSAAWIPARRAASVDPMVALRYE